MKSFRKVASALAVMPLAIAGLIAGAGTASATTVVPPGGSGSACSGYVYADSTHTRYWQTCAWADSDEVWFTVNFGNSSSFSWTPVLVWEDYIKSGASYTCGSGAQANFTVAAHSTRGTPKAACKVARAKAAYASVGTVFYTSGSSGVIQHSPTLQAQ